MEKRIKCVHFNRSGNSDGKGYPTGDFGIDRAKKVNAYHKSFPEYRPTPLANLKNLASELGVGGIYVKDESYRFGLNAFKVLGGSYAIGTYIAEKLGKDIGELPYDVLTGPGVKDELGGITFITATDGNHGRGIAWTANRLGQKSVVYMPQGSAPERLENIQKLGSDASIKDLKYDDTVRLAASDAEKNGWVLVQDTAWEGYEDIPKWIMQGYTTMALEASEQMEGVKPTHIFLQAGVGAMPGGIAAFFADLYKGDEKPVITIVEPSKADCFYRTAEANDGELHFVTEKMDSIMAGLCCGEPCTIAWDILKDYADNFVSMPDYIAAEGMRILGNPMGDDPKVISGESGAAGLGLAAELLRNPEKKRIRDILGLDEDSVILCFSTEGDTDKENYKRIVWDGMYPRSRD